MQHSMSSFIAAASPKGVRSQIEARTVGMNPKKIIPINASRKGEPMKDITHPEKVEKLATSMGEKGWDGRPLLVEKLPNGDVQSWTGTHRLAAARKVDMKKVPVVVLDTSQLKEEVSPGKGKSFKAVNGKYDKDRARLLEEHSNDAAAIALAKEEALHRKF